MEDTFFFSPYKDGFKQNDGKDSLLFVKEDNNKINNASNETSNEKYIKK